MRRTVLVGLLLGVVLPRGAPAFAGTGVFRSAFKALGGSNPTGIAVGDFNGDGDTDMVASNAGIMSKDLTIFQGFGNDGTVDVDHAIPLETFPSGVLKGKFDGDDIDDLIVAQANDNAIVFLRGVANGSDYFDLPGPPITVGHSPVGLAAADFTSDGKLDLAVANEGGDLSPGSVSILRGNGDGTFELLDSLPADLGTRALAIGNIDAEPGLDIVALNTLVNPNTTISLYVSDGHGVFTARGTLPAGVGTQDLALADLNADSKLDLILAVANEDRVTVQFGNGDRTFGAVNRYEVGNTPQRVLVTDLTGDGLLDIVAANRRSQDLSVLVATAPGSFRPARSYVADMEPEALGIGDFGGDEVPDLVSSNQGDEDGASVTILRNLGDGLLHAVEDVPAGSSPSDVAVADIDGDAEPDLVVATNTGVRVLYAGPRGFRDPTDIATDGRALSVATADLSGDGRPDIVASDADNNRVAVVLNRGAGHFAEPAVYPVSAAASVVAIGDFNADNRPDVAVTAVSPDRFCQGGERNNQPCRQQVDCAPNGVCAAEGKVSILLQQPNGQFVRAAQDVDVEETPITMASIDADCDGRDDLLVGNYASNTVSVLRSSGDGSFTTAQTLSITQIGATPSGIAVADFDRDGVQDFAVCNSLAPGTSQNVRLFKGSCTGPFAQLAGGAIRVGELASGLVARDFTGDQLVDLLVVNFNKVNLLRGTPSGTMVRVGQSDAVSRMPVAGAAGDFDGNGRYDGVTANNDPNANNFSVLYNCVNEPFCHPFGQTVQGAGPKAVRGDANNDTVRSAADLVAVAAEVMDGDGFDVEAIGRGAYSNAGPGADANGDGRVDAQDRMAVARRIFAAP